MERDLDCAAGMEESSDYSNDGFRLLCMILVDSLSPGHIIKLPLQGGAVLTGRNGRGKTSLLQLLPFFYGERPSRIVVPSHGRSTFLEYYLPRTTSYVAFEYQRPGGDKRLIIAHADRTSEHVLYRFVRHGFDIRQLTTEAGDLVPAQDLAKHLKVQGFVFAERQLESTSDYRAVIQGVPGAARDSQLKNYLRELAAEYAFTTVRRPLNQIEKIVNGMFKRQTKFEDLQQMVIDCVTDDAGDHAISADRRKIEDWPKGYKAYTTAIGMAPKMSGVSQARDRLATTQASLGEVRSKYRRLMDHTAQSLHAQEGARARKRGDLDKEKENYELARRTLADKEQSARQEAAFEQKKAGDLKKQHDTYEGGGIRDRDARVRSVADKELDLQNLDLRRQTVLGEHTQISANYDRLKQQEIEQFNAYRDDVQRDRQDLTAAYEESLRSVETAQATLLREATVRRQAEREPFVAGVDSANTELGRCQLAVSQPALDPEISQLVEAKQAALDKARQQKDEAEKHSRNLENEAHVALQAFQTQERSVDTASRVHESAGVDLAAKRRLLSPEPGTLLHFLMSEHPGWSRDIARVIRPDLLNRRDLSPALVSEETSLYGVSICLDRLPSHPAANTAAAEQEVLNAEAHLDATRKALDAAREELARLSEVREKTSDAANKQRQVCQTHEAQVSAAQADLSEARRMAEESKRQAVALAEQRFAQASALLSAAKSKLSGFDAETLEQNTRLLEGHAKEKTSLRQQRDSKLQQLADDLAAKDKSRATRLAEYDAERDTALRDRGLDLKILQDLDKRIKDINLDLAEIRRFTEQVREWHYWLAHQWPAYDTHLAKAEEASRVEQGYTQEIAEHDATWRQLDSQLKAQIAEIDTDIANLRTLNEQARQAYGALVEYPEVAVGEYDPSWSLSTLASLVSPLRREADSLRIGIKRGLSDIASAFRRYPGTPPEQYLQSSVETLSPNPDIDWIAPLEKWFASEHQGYHRILRMEAGNIAADVQHFYRTMEDFHRQVLQFNRELHGHLNTSLVFESISSVEIEVRSTLAEMSYWPAVTEMAATNRIWQEGSPNELPPPEFAQNIERLLEQWETKSGIRADLTSLIRIQGVVVENGNRRPFKKASDLENVSSNGLSYLVLATIFVAFINRIRRDANVNIIWALDELKDLDAGNVVGLVGLLRQNNITLVSAFPDPDPDTLSLFRHRFTVEPDRRLATVLVDSMQQTPESMSVVTKEAAHV